MRPPSVVRSTVPAPPLAQATSADTALTPRSRTVTPLTCGCHAIGAATGCAAPSQASTAARAVAAVMTSAVRTASAGVHRGIINLA